MRVTSQPMQYDSEPSTRLPPCVAGLEPGDVLPPPPKGGGDEASEARREHYGRVIAALLYAATGGLDQVGRALHRRPAGP